MKHRIRGLQDMVNGPLCVLYWAIIGHKQWENIIDSEIHMNREENLKLEVDIEGIFSQTYQPHTPAT